MKMSQMFAAALRVAFAAIVMTTAIESALAQQPSQQQQKPASPATIANAREILVLEGADNFFRPLASVAIEQSKGLFLQQNPTVAKDVEEIGVALRSEYAKRHDDVINEGARIYATRFSEQEIKDLLAFYKSPLGQKMLAEKPVILEQMGRFGQQWLRSLQDEVSNRMRAELKKKGHDF